MGVAIRFRCRTRTAGARARGAVQRFLGKFVNKLDAKGRVSVPAQFRDVLTKQGLKGFYCAPSAIHAGLTGYGEDFFADIDAKLKQLDPYSSDYAARATQAFGDVDYLECDPEGRIRLPEHLIAHGAIRDRVQFVGLSQFFELWNPETYPSIHAERVADLRRAYRPGGAP